MPRTFAAAVAAALAAAAPAAAATLSGFASLPAETFIAGPTSGQFQNGGNGVTPPYPNAQPVQGFSAVERGPSGFWAMSDNGFGARGNSADALLLFHDITVDFRTASGGTGAVTVNQSYALSDPNRLLSFEVVSDLPTYPNGDGTVPVDPAITAGKLLTGADLDIESFNVDANGDIWIGDEFGPFLIRANSDFEVIAAEIDTPGVTSPDNPKTGGAGANLGRSRGFEGMAISEDGLTLYPLLEGTVAGDPAGSLRLYAFDVTTESFTDQYLYQLSPEAGAIGEMTRIEDKIFVVIERDGGQGATAQFKKMFLINLDAVGPDGVLLKTEIADLLNLADPFDLDGDGADVFTFPFVTIESVLPIDPFTLLVANDNNFPGSAGRTPGVPDDNEIILITLDRPIASYAPAPIPLPAGGWMLLAGLAALAGLARRR